VRVASSRTRRPIVVAVAVLSLGTGLGIAHAAPLSPSDRSAHTTAKSCERRAIARPHRLAAAYVRSHDRKDLRLVTVVKMVALRHCASYGTRSVYLSKVRVALPPKNLGPDRMVSALMDPVRLTHSNHAASVRRVVATTRRSSCHLPPSSMAHRAPTATATFVVDFTASKPGPTGAAIWSAKYTVRIANNSVPNGAHCRES
jgi:hypothetical protein